MTEIKKEIISDGREIQDDALDKLENAVARIVSDPNLDDKSKAIHIRSITSELIMHESFSGPMPSPKMMAGYENIIPGSAERILIMAEEQHRHRIAMESNVIPKQMKQSGRGQIFALILCFTLIVFAAYCVCRGAYHTATITVGLTIAALAGLFITGKYEIKKDLKNKSQEN